ncbi:acyltransferase [Alteromonas sp. H39]|uniref:acyltransferase n=1 Tax=Alteromonas sp. H39 TaxID=3389876 RepID=UPI0039E0ECB6
MQSTKSKSSEALPENGKKVRLTLRRYVKRQNGVRLGASGSFRNMLVRAFGARGFDRFWTHWNPIFSFYLGKYIFHPVSQVMPVSIALVITFVANGLLHDAVTMAVRLEPAWFFTPWFLIMGLMAAIHRQLPVRYANVPFLGRILINTLHIAVALIYPVWMHSF